MESHLWVEWGPLRRLSRGVYINSPPPPELVLYVRANKMAVNQIRAFDLSDMALHLLDSDGTFFLSTPAPKLGGAFCVGRYGTFALDACKLLIGGV